MEDSVLLNLEKLQLTKDEEEDIRISNPCQAELLEECSLSLFGKLLSDRKQNQRALKNVLRSAWKMGSDLRIVDVGNNIFQFKFSSKFQLEWVEKSGPWSFENNILLLCRWQRGLSTSNIIFSHTPLWVQVWGLPFEHMTESTGKEIGCRIGNFLEVDKRSWQSEQAKFMRIRVELQIDKPLRRGGYLTNENGGRTWLTYKYERLPTLCFSCGRMGHDEKHCPEPLLSHDNTPQYGDWLRAGWQPRENFSKMGSGSSDKSTGTATATDDVYTRATPVKPTPPEGFGGNNDTGGKPSLGSETQTRNNDANLVLQAAEDQSGWDRPRDGKRSLRASGESRDKPASSNSGSNRSPIGGQTDALSTVGQPKTLNAEAQEATSPMKPKINVCSLGNTAQPSPEPANISGPTRRVKLKKAARDISKVQAHDVEMSTPSAETNY
ncbi:uncharacterized protein CFP56_040613 [Quercus suber]|uniref:CCHC-type domain-containing protein n=1 Tax=Quercus suber TaxID=58331 RepID=A0AAW0IX01_QUESU